MEIDPPAPTSLLVVMAHPDDMEFSAGATVARWSDAGCHVELCLCTDGDKGTSDADRSPAEVAAQRRAETDAAAAVLGVRAVHRLGHPDGTLVADLGLRRDIVRVIRSVRPAAVLTSDPMRRYGPTFLNHPDHRAAAEACLDAVFPSARDPLVFPELLAGGLEPHRVADVWLTNPVEPSHAVDVSAHIDRKLDALREHRSQVSEERLSTLVPQRLSEMGALAGLEAAELFFHIALP